MSDPAYTGFGDLKFSQDDRSTNEFIARQLMNGMATATLAQVKAVREKSVDVQPMVSQIDGAGTGLDHGVIHDLPFFTLRAGPCEIRAKPRVGDIGLVVFCHNDISTVKATSKPALPASRRRFDWSDGIFLGGLLSLTDATTVIEVDADDNVVITAPTIKLNGNVEHTGDWTSSGTITGTTDVVGGGKHLKTHTHSGVTTGSGTSGPPS